MKQYCGKWSLLTTGDLFGVDMNYSLIPNYLDPFDYDAAAKFEGRAFAVATDIETGKPVYLPLKDLREDLPAVRASSSLPLVSRNVKIGDRYYLDGGISDSIPIRKSIQDGNRKNVVIMTKEEGFVRQPAGAELALVRARYLRYPKVYELMRERHLSYRSESLFVRTVLLITGLGTLWVKKLVRLFPKIHRDMGADTAHSFTPQEKLVCYASYSHHKHIFLIA